MADDSPSSRMEAIKRAGLAAQQVLEMEQALKLGRRDGAVIVRADNDRELYLEVCDEVWRAAVTRAHELSIERLASVTLRDEK
jgi:hypothetical protein